MRYLNFEHSKSISNFASCYYCWRLKLWCGMCDVDFLFRGRRFKFISRVKWDSKYIYWAILGVQLEENVVFKRTTILRCWVLLISFQNHSFLNLKALQWFSSSFSEHIIERKLLHDMSAKTEEWVSGNDKSFCWFLVFLLPDHLREKNTAKIVEKSALFSLLWKRVVLLFGWAKY